MSEILEGPRVLARRAAGVGHLLLNRPRAINALSHDMVLAVSSALQTWAADPKVCYVVITGAGERGFCAGGDVRSMAAAVRAGVPQETLDFLRDEYRMNAQIGGWDKPIVAILDGVTMGGGIGVGGHAAIRVVTERSVLAMPEARIGFAPDVGGTFLLSRMPGFLGEHLAMTAASMTGADAVATGFADHYVESGALPELLAALDREEDGDPDATVRRFASAPPPSLLLRDREWIDDAYAEGSAAEIATRLESLPSESACAAAHTIRSLSPFAVSVSLAAVRAARELPDLPSVLDQEWRTACGMLAREDFIEGVRAQLVDKDFRPVWNPARLEDVEPVDVDTVLSFPVPEPLGL